MAQNFSFDIVSEVNLQEVDNGINQAQKELAQRFDFKGSKASIDYDKTSKKITLVADDEFKLTALKDILSGRMAKRGVSMRAMDQKPIEKSFEGTVRQVLELTIGLPIEKAKDLVKIIKGLNLKVQPQIDGTKVRVVSSKKDDLQAVIAGLKDVDFPLPLQFTNYR